QPLERGHARARTAALELADEALADAGRVGDVLQRAPAKEADRLEPLAEVDRARAGRRRLDGGFSHLNLRFTEMKRPYGARARRSTRRLCLYSKVSTIGKALRRRGSPRRRARRRPRP